MRLLGLVSVVGLVVASGASAMTFDVGGFVGKRYTENADDDSTLILDEYAVEAHVAPVPLMPIAVGGRYSMLAPHLDQLGVDVDAASGTQFSLSGMAWLPMMPIVTPYAKIRYGLSGGMTVETSLGDFDAEMGGWQIAFGARYDILPLIGVVGEVGSGNGWTKAEGTSDTADWDEIFISLGLNAQL